MGELPKLSFRDPSLPLEERLKNLLSQLTLEEKISLLPTRQAPIPRLGIKEFWVGGEAAHGIAWLGVATIFPQPIGLCCTFDTELMKKIGEVVSEEARAYFYMRGRIGGLMLWAPTVDLERDPRWGRTEEGYGEDPYLAGEMASSFIQGMMGDHPFYLKTAPTSKHFFANNNEKDRAVFSATIDPRNMFEYYLDVFRRVITKGKAPCIMTAYNEINGVPCIINPIVKKIVKEEWGLSGFVVTDAGDFSQIVTMHKTFENHHETLTYALRAGIDCFTDDPNLIIESAKEALKQNLITEEDIDRAVANILRVRFRLGEFDSEDQNPYSYIPPSKICDKEHLKLSYLSALKSIVLLKNEKILPLDRNKIKKIAIIGPLADKVYTDHYSGTLPYKVSVLQGVINKFIDKNVDIVYWDSFDRVAIKSLKNETYIKSIESGESPLWARNKEISRNEIFRLIDWGWGNKSLQAESNGKYVTVDDQGNVWAKSEEVRGWFVKELFHIDPAEDSSLFIRSWNGKYLFVSEEERLKVKDSFDNSLDEKFVIEKLEDGIEKTCNLVKDSDFVILCVGNNPFVNGKEEVDRPDIVLPEHQEKLIKEIYRVNPNVILIVISSYPFAINWAKENIPAIIYSSHSGEDMGNAIADVLFGDYSPAGRLNMTWYKSSSDIPPITDYDIIKGKRTYMYFDKEVLFPFGHGLTYTEFSYSNLSLSKEIYGPEESIELEFDLENIGNMDSDEVPQVYVKCLESRVKRPLLQLKGFKRVFLAKGEKKKIHFSIPVKELFIYDVTREKYCIEKGYYEILVGASSKDVRLRDRIFIDGEKIPNRDLTILTKAINYDDYTHITLKTKRNFEENYVHALDDGSWILFKNVEFSKSVGKIVLEVLSPSENFLKLIWKDNEISLNIPQTSEWKKLEYDIPPISGVSELYVKMGKGLSLNWLKFM